MEHCMGIAEMTAFETNSAVHCSSKCSGRESDPTTLKRLSLSSCCLINHQVATNMTCYCSKA
eukprot:scaffold132360_cov13-Tisochrysis_lutea.AAC.1